MSKSNQTPMPKDGKKTIQYSGVCDSRVGASDKNPTNRG